MDDLPSEFNVVDASDRGEPRGVAMPLLLDGSYDRFPARCEFTVSFLADDILRMRYVSINGQMRKMLMVVKMRRSAHSIDIHEYQITKKGVVIGEPLRGYRGLTTGIPEPWSVESGQNDPALWLDRPPRPAPKPPRTRRSKKDD